MEQMRLAIFLLISSSFATAGTFYAEVCGSVEKVGPLAGPILTFPFQDSVKAKAKEEPKNFDFSRVVDDEIPMQDTDLPKVERIIESNSENFRTDPTKKELALIVKGRPRLEAALNTFDDNQFGVIAMANTYGLFASSAYTKADIDKFEPIKEICVCIAIGGLAHGASTDGLSYADKICLKRFK